MSVGQPIIHRRHPGRVLIPQVRHLHRRGLASKQQQPISADVPRDIHQNVDLILAHLGRDFIVVFRLSSIDLVEGGLSGEEILAEAKALDLVIACQGLSKADLQRIIEAAFEDRANISPATKGEVRDAVDQALDLLDRGEARVAVRQADGKWQVNQWLKKAVLLSFRLNDMTTISGAPGGASWWDKVPSKFDGWGASEHAAAGFRSVPGCIVRRSAFVAPGVVLMPSFVNLGASVDAVSSTHLRAHETVLDIV